MLSYLLPGIQNTLASGQVFKPDPSGSREVMSRYLTNRGREEIGERRRGHCVFSIYYFILFYYFRNPARKSEKNEKIRTNGILGRYRLGFVGGGAEEIEAGEAAAEERAERRR